MAEIPEHILRNLLCVVCKQYLSSAPVMLNANGESICGKCEILSEDDDVTEERFRNKAYEELANFVKFPCCNKSVGCTFKLPLKEMTDHEKECEFRMQKCPLFPLDACLWEGKYIDLKQHFEEAHKESIMKQPFKFSIDVRSDLTNWYIMEIMSFMFLLQVECNAAAAKFWLCVRFLGDTKFADLFEFTAEISNENGELVKKESVCSVGFDLLTDNRAMEVCINRLTQVLGHIEDLLTTITVKFKSPYCLTCKKLKPENSYLQNNGYVCSKCKAFSMQDKITKPIQYNLYYPPATISPLVSVSPLSTMSSSLPMYQNYNNSYRYLNMCQMPSQQPYFIPIISWKHSQSTLAGTQPQASATQPPSLPTASTNISSGNANNNYDTITINKCHLYKLPVNLPSNALTASHGLFSQTSPCYTSSGVFYAGHTPRIILCIKCQHTTLICAKCSVLGNIYNDISRPFHGAYSQICCDCVLHDTHLPHW